MTKLVLIDGNAIIHRAYHAMPPMRSPKGEAVSAVRGFVSMLLVIIEKLKPTHIAVCFDRPEKTFRQEKHAAYQSHRPKLEDDFSSQFQKTYDVLTAMKISQYSLAGFEADDVVGTIAKEANVDEVVVVTGDRDMLQLVNGKVRLYMPVKGLSEGKLYGDAEVMDRMEVLPKHIVDYKALVGDPSDNYPGVPGIGPKTAIMLINKYDSFKNIYRHLDELPKKLAEKLEKGKESGELSYELATIVSNCDIDFNLEDAAKWDIDSKEALKLFDEYGFKTLTEQIIRLAKAWDSEMQGTLF